MELLRTYMPILSVGLCGDHFHAIIELGVYLDALLLEEQDDECKIKNEISDSLSSVLLPV
eukprot:Pgem_evm1s16605